MWLRGKANSSALRGCEASIEERVVEACRDTSPIRKHPPIQDPPRTLGIGLQYGPRGLRSLVSEVPLHWGCEDPLGPLGSSSSQDRRTPEIIL